MAEVRVVTGPEWNRFARACKAAGDGGLMREVRRGIRESAQPAAEAVKAEAPAYMPDRYAADMASTLKVSSSATATGVRLRGRAKTRRGKARELRRLEAGVLRHPLWGRWLPGKFLQPVRPGFWSEPLSRQTDTLRRGIRQAMDRVADKIAD